MALSPHTESPHSGLEILDGIRTVVDSLSVRVDEGRKSVPIPAEDLVSLNREIEHLAAAMAEQHTAIEKYGELIRALEETLTIGRRSGSPQIQGDNRKVLALAQQRAAEAQLGFRLAHRGDQTEAIVATVRDLVTVKHPLEARSLALHLMSNRATRVAGRVCAAIVASKFGLNDLAAGYLQLVPDELALKYASAEWYAIQFGLDPHAAIEHFQRAANGRYPSATWSFIIRSGLSYGLREQAQSLCRLFLENPEIAATENSADRASIQFINDFLQTRQVTTHAGHSGNPGGATIGIWDNSHPDIAGPSADLGLHLESAILLSRLQRWASLQPAGEDLAGALESLPKPANDPIAGDASTHCVRVAAVPRYLPDEAAPPTATWTVFHGLFGDKIFEARSPFPHGNNIRPIFFGFELQDIACGDSDMMAALRAYGPVGCRDWTSTFALLGHGVPAFYSGALASLATPLPAAGGRNVQGHGLRPDLAGLIGPGQGAGTALRAQQKSARLKSSTPGRKLETAIHYLGALGSLDKISTPHQETNLIGKALGAKVDFTPPARAISDAATMPGITPQAEESPAAVSVPLDAVLAMISADEDEGAVYATWSRLTAGLVAEAKRRFRLSPAVPPPAFDVAAIGEAVRATTVQMGPAGLRDDGETVNVAMSCDANLFGQLAVAIESLLRNTRRNLRIHLLSRGLGRDDFRYLAALFPDIAFDFIPCDSVDYGSVLSTARYITVSAIDRLLLPAVLSMVPKIVYLDVDLMVLADVGKLFDIKMKSAPLAACSATADWSKSGYGHLLAVAQRMDPAKAADLKHLTLLTHREDFLAFNSGVLVMNLEQMRADDFCGRFLGYLSYFDMNDQDVLYCYAGDNWRRLQPNWNCIPSHVYVTRPRIVHWAGPAKPWQALRMPYQNAWLELVQDVAAKAAVAGLDAAPITGLAKVAP